MRIFQQRHENWLHLLIAHVLFVRLSWSKVQDIPETFFVTYHQGTIVKSSQLLQNMVLNTHRVVRLDTITIDEWITWIQATSERFFWKMTQLPAKSTAKNDIVYIGDFCILKSTSSTDVWSFQMWLEWSQFRTALLIWAATCGFQQCGILTRVDSGEPVQPPSKLRNSKSCSVSSLTVIEYSSK